MERVQATPKIGAEGGQGGVGLTSGLLVPGERCGFLISSGLCSAAAAGIASDRWGRSAEWLALPSFSAMVFFFCFRLARWFFSSPAGDGNPSLLLLPQQLSPSPHRLIPSSTARAGIAPSQKQHPSLLLNYRW